MAACRGAVRAAAGDEQRVSERLLEEHLCTSGLPGDRPIPPPRLAYVLTKLLADPDAVIRTSGERRLSNFLLWQLAYAELFFVDKTWPELTREDLRRVLHEFADRQRRFGT